MSIGRIQAEAVVIVIALFSHLFAELNGVLIAEVSELPSPLEDDHYLCDLSLGAVFVVFFPVDDLQLQFPGQSLEVPPRLEYELDLHELFHHRVGVIELSYFLDDEVQDVSQVFRVFEFELIFLYSIE